LRAGNDSQVGGGSALDKVDASALGAGGRARRVSRERSAASALLQLEPPRVSG